MPCIDEKYSVKFIFYRLIFTNEVVKMYELMNLSTGKIVRKGEALEKLLQDLPEGLYEVKEDGKFVMFYSTTKPEHQCWI